MMILKYIGLTLSLILLIGCILWIARQCWLDSKDDFKMVWTDFKTMLKKKKAD